jgi:serine/threonine protein kinase
MRRIGRYIVRGLLGRGGMAKVFKVELAPIGKIAALKLFDPAPVLVNLMGADRLKALFIGEATALARLQHPHIVSIHDFDENQGNPFYVMDFEANNLGVVMGESYRVEQPSRVIDVDKALRYTHHTLNGLACLHHAGIIHRDIKPFNLLISAQDRIKICDFGLSKLRGEIIAGPANLNVGSPYYAAPEQERQPDQVAPNADLYPVGIMLYRMLTGRLPLTAPTDPVYQPPSALNTNLDTVWDRFVEAAIDPQPQARFGSALTMRQALHGLTAHWARQKERACALIDSKPRFRMSDAPPVVPCLRQDPIKTGPGKAPGHFQLNPLWQPETYWANHFEARPDNLVLDHTTALIWQRTGSAYPHTWQQAQAYAGHLNNEKLGALESWRLPTVEELMTLLRPAVKGRDRCIASIFDTTQRWLWSADRRSFVAAYYADIEVGFIGWQDVNAPFYVRAVCNTKK